MADFIEAYPEAKGRSLRPLAAPEFTTVWHRSAHEARRSLGRVHALGVWAVENVTVVGRASHLFIDGERFAGPSVVPRYVENLVASGVVRPRDGLELPERAVDEPAVLFMGWGPDVYGHALIEMAPKIRIAAKALAESPERLAFVVPSSASGWFRQVLALAGARRFIEYDSTRERPLLRRAWVATMPRDLALHPACQGLFAAMRPPVPEWTGEALFVTRRAAKRVTRPINLLNAAQIEALAERAGFRVVSPELATVAEQARMFANARLVVGEYGSALNNAVFCRRDAVVGAIGARSELLSAISAECGLRLSYFDPDNNPEDPAGYTVDPSRFARWLEALMEAAGR